MPNIGDHRSLTDNLVDVAPNIAAALVAASLDTAAGAITAAGASGTSPPAPVLGAGANNLRGSLTFGSGSSTQALGAVTVLFSAPLPAVPRVIVITPLNAATAAIAPFFATAITTAGFTITSTSLTTASQANTVYSVAYQVLL